MSTQMKNYIYDGDGKEYEIYLSEKKLFDAKKHGFKPDYMRTSSVQDGYLCKFRFDSKQNLILDTLTIANIGDEVPLFCGQPFVRNEKGFFKHFVTYSNVSLHIDYTGRLLLGIGPIDEYLGFSRFQGIHYYRQG